MQQTIMQCIVLTPIYQQYQSMRLVNQAETKASHGHFL